jgi:hypothetical protein
MAGIEWTSYMKAVLTHTKNLNQDKDMNTSVINYSDEELLDEKLITTWIGDTLVQTEVITSLVIDEQYTITKFGPLTAWFVRSGRAQWMT